jgi:glycosyltransferase involved in cell wall biosynthesis
LRTLHVEAGRHYYGGARQVRYLVEGLAARGVECVLAVPPDSPLARMTWDARATVVPLAMGGDADLGLVLRLKRMIRSWSPDVVHLHSRRGADWLGGLAARLAGTPSVLTRRVDNPEPPWVGALKYRLFDRVVAISGAVAQALEASGLRHCPAIVHSAVDPASVATRCDSEAFRSALDIPAGAPLVGMVAQFIARKGHETALDALPRVLERHPSAHLVFFGRGPREDAVRRRVARDGLAGRVRFAGFRDDMEAVYACLDVLLHPAREEGLGVALLQAGAAGIPVVACRAGGIPEVVAHAETGLLVDPDDTGALAAATCLLLDSPEERRAMGRAARRGIEARFSVAGMVDAYLRIYGEVSGQDVSLYVGAAREAG